MATNAQVLASSTAAAQAAAKMIGGTYTQSVGFTPNAGTTIPNITTNTQGTPLPSVQSLVNAYTASGPLTAQQITGYTPLPTTITPQSLAPVQAFPAVTAQNTPAYPVSTLQTPEQLQPTSQEQQISAYTSPLRDLYNSLADKPADQTAADTKYGVDAAQSSIQDLTAQLTGIKNEAAAIPLQLQQGAADRGVTTPVLQAQQNSRLRTNAIAALGVSTLLAASQGQLANAQAMADKMVAQKYDPIYAQIAADEANIALIKGDPLTSIQDQNRADARQVQIDAQKQQTNLAVQNTQEVQKIAISAASNQAAFKPTTQYQNVTQALQAIQNTSDPVLATQIASETGLIAPVKGTTSTGASTTRVLGSSTTGYYTYDSVTGKTTPINGGGSSSSTGSTYQPGMLTTLLQSQGKTADDATLQSLWKQYGTGGTYANDSTHNSVIYSALGGKLTSTKTTAPSTKTVGVDLTDAKSAIAAGADPEAVRQAFIADHPTSSASWNSYFGVSNSTSGYQTPKATTAPTTSTGLFGWGFLGL